MKRTIKSIIMILSLTLLVGCAAKDNGSAADDGSPDLSAYQYKIKATVNKVSESEFEVTATEDNEGAYGVYRVLTSPETKYEDAEGEPIERSAINEGDVILISYNGQVMRSFPPQIVAIKIEILE